MNYGRATGAAQSARHQRTAVLASVTAAMLAAAMLLAAVLHLHGAAARDAISSMRAAWIHIATPGMQFPEGKLSARLFKTWLGAVGACYLARPNFRFYQTL